MKVYSSSDYAGMETGDYKFYYGYEKTTCPDHGDGCNGICPDGSECTRARWCFVAWIHGAEIGRLTAAQLGHSQLDDPRDVLLSGIARFGDKFWRT